MSKHTTPPQKFTQGWLTQLDGRTGVAQVMRERYTALTNDLGGAASLSYQERLLVERVLWLEYWIAQQEQGLANGGDVDMGRYTQAVNSVQGLVMKLGLQRRAKDTPDLASFLRERATA
ncbi:hypothetical protein CWE08_04395 [Aliidiomarina iranensis]|uniref:Uncharacterized protein n=1 Tax=Aliidiomarina iranensis TaxID=1434071 RepID=A0A432W085_9GAMM|nr:hypothetical protein [Aliidiomarina iranensis]RUO22426.1 hypothetical protein CWE08_04395 [Aliidiomarina iranensis]